MRVPTHEATTAQLCAAYPFAARGVLPGGGVLVGRDLSGGLFVHDPFELYRYGVLTNPNLLVLGQIGRGKSAFVKTYLYRHAAFGRRILVLDPKGEYAPLARALGARPISLEPGGSIHLNPLQISATDGRATRRRRLSTTLDAIATALLERRLTPVEHAMVDLVAEELPARSPLIGDAVDRLLDPSDSAAHSLRLAPDRLADSVRDVGLALRRLSAGDLSGLFDRPSSEGIGLDGSVVVLDLSALYRSSALAVAIVCVQAALEELTIRTTRPTLLVLDEAWALFENLGAARFLQSSLKLARARGLANIVVTHRLSDLRAAGGEGSAAARLVEGVVADCETVVCYAQAESEVPTAADVLGLSESVATVLPRLRRGVALWRVGSEPYLVEHRLAPNELSLVDTDQALLSDAAAWIQ